MYLRANKRKKDGKEHRYWSVEESRRLRSGRVVQRRVLYLGEINDSQQAAWRKTLEVFDEAEQRAASLSLFPEDRALPADALDGVQVKLQEMELRRPRAFGNYWLGCEVWRQLGLGGFREGRLGKGREKVPWAKVLELLVVSRLVAPGSEFRLHRQGFDQSALGELLGTGFAVAEKDRLYRCLDRIGEHKTALFDHLRRRWQDLFQARFDVLLYDLTSTYLEGEGEEILKAKHGYSRDHRGDCRQVVIALVVTLEGFPLAYEVLAGNTSDCTTLRGFLDKIEAQYGRARRVWIMDWGIPTEEVLAEIRSGERQVFYLVGTPRGKIQQYAQRWLELPWQKVRESVEVKLFAEDGELYVLAKSEGRHAKERAMRRRKLVRLLKTLRKLRRSAPARDQLLLRIGAAKQDAGRAFGFVPLRLPKEGEEVTRQTFSFHLDQEKLHKAELRDGHYLLRSNLLGEEPEVLWELYIRLTQIEAAFKTLKSELGLRPIYHQVEKRVEAHIFVAFLAYALSVTLRQRLAPCAPGLTPRAVLEKLATIQMLDVCLPTTDGRWLIMPRYTQPESLYDEGRVPLGPSAVNPEQQIHVKGGRLMSEIPREMALQDVKQAVQDFRNAAQVARDAGFDGVQIQGGFVYLFQQFLHEVTNRRADQYGGPVENRARILFEALEAVLEVWPSSRVGVKAGPMMSERGAFRATDETLRTSEYVYRKMAGYKLSHMLLMRQMADLTGSPIEHMAGDAVVHHFRHLYTGTLILSVGINAIHGAHLISGGAGDLIAFGRDYIANPDLAERIRLDAPLNEQRPEFFYGNSATGYTDYPTLMQSQLVQERSNAK